MRYLFVGLLMSGVVFSQVPAWQADGVVICDWADHQYFPLIISDGSAGAIIAWQDRRNGTDYNIYAQRVDMDGVCQWDSGGVVVCDAASGQFHPVLASDGSGGAIIAWYDYRASDANIYAQRVDAAGLCQWPQNGVVICDAEDTQEYPQLVSDGAGGAIITWHDERNDFGGVYVQRIDSNGDCLWDSNGTLLCDLYLGQEYPQIVSDGSAGAILVWHDGRNGVDYDIYAQRVDSSGDTLWQPNGVVICNAPNSQMSPMIASDGSSGAVITWENYGSSPNPDVKVQRINADGVTQWDSNGVMVCDATGNQFDPVIVSDGAAGAIITWYDFRTLATDDIYAQRVDAAGDCLWDSNGVVICDAAFHQRYPQIASDGAGGAIIAWDDQRFVYHDIYAQRVSPSGVCLWDSNGVVISAAADDQNDPFIVADGLGGAIITWEDERNTVVNCDIYAQKVDSTGSVGIRESGRRRCVKPGLIVYPNPCRNSITIINAGRDLEIYDVSGRMIARTDKGFWNGKDLNNQDVKSGIYFLRAQGLDPVKLVKLR